jgi:hypothetical protein
MLSTIIHALTWQSRHGVVKYLGKSTYISVSSLKLRAAGPLANRYRGVRLRRLSRCFKSSSRVSFCTTSHPDPLPLHFLYSLSKKIRRFILPPPPPALLHIGVCPSHSRALIPRRSCITLSHEPPWQTLAAGVGGGAAVWACHRRRWLAPPVVHPDDLHLLDHRVISVWFPHAAAGSIQ